MTKLPYEQAFARIRSEFLEMPGMRLTSEQVERLTGVDRSICQSVLDDLVRSRFLCIVANGRYRRMSDTAAEPTSTSTAPAHVTSRAASHRTRGA
jgi:DNA-binding GntR family transcriptional regulator